MKTQPDCIPCQLATALKTLKKATQDHGIICEVMKSTLKLLHDFGFEVPPPRVYREIMRLIKEKTSNQDPFSEDKKIQTQKVWEIYPILKENIQKAEDPLRLALILSCQGNLIDIVRDQGPEPSFLLDLPTPLIDHYEWLCSFLSKAKTVLIIADNAGEAVLDRLMVEQLKEKYELRVFYAVRGMPILNDVTFEDLKGLGFEGLCEVISTEDDTPGVVLEFTGEAFRRAFKEADLIIAKGQGNFETLEELVDERLFFLFWAKCEPILNYLKLKERGPLVMSFSLMKCQSFS